MSGLLEVLATGPLVTVQDHGRAGAAHLGVPRSGALDRPAADLAVRLVGDQPGTAVLEVVLGGLAARVHGGRWVAVTGAPALLRVDGRPRGHARAEWVPDGSLLELGVPPSGLRSYVALAGGLLPQPVLGSRSTDTLSGLGPAPVTAGDRIAVGDPAGVPTGVEAVPPVAGGAVRVHRGPRADWVRGDALDLLAAGAWTVGPGSDRVGLRLEGDPVPRSREEELASEGLVVGAVQLPPDGRPVVFLADHPTTGGYPVVAVVDERDLWRCAQLRPGERLALMPAVGPGR